TSSQGLIPYPNDIIWKSCYQRFRHRGRPTVHLLLIIILLLLAFPMAARFIGGILSAGFWLIVVVIVIALVGAPRLARSSHKSRESVRLGPTMIPASMLPVLMIRNSGQ